MYKSQELSKRPWFSFAIKIPSNLFLSIFTSTNILSNSSENIDPYPESSTDSFSTLESIMIMIRESNKKYGKKIQTA